MKTTLVAGQRAATASARALPLSGPGMMTSVSSRAKGCAAASKAATPAAPSDASETS